MSNHHRRRDRQASGDSHEAGRERRHRHLHERRQRHREREARDDAYDEEREERRRRRRRERPGTSESGRRSGDDVRGRDRRHHRRAHERDRHTEKQEGRQPDDATGYITPGLEDTSYALNAYSPFGTPPAAPPAYEDRRAKQASSKEKYRNDEKAYTTRPTELELGKSFSPFEGEAVDVGEGEGDGKTEQKDITNLERWGGPFIYIIPIFTAVGLLFAATCSADSWRVKVHVVSVDLPNDVFARLLATGKNLGKSGGSGEGGGSGSKEDGGAIVARAPELVAAGYVSVGFWGWCVSRPDQSEYACSPTNAWYTMEDLLETAEITSTIPSRAFHDGLIHGLVMYGPAMVAAMAAAVPAGIHIWRRLFRNNRNVEAGVALHASLFCGGVFSFIAFMISKALEWRLNEKLKLPVSAGTIPTMAGIASLLLFLALAASMIPVIYRRVKRQQDILGSWEDVRAAQPTPTPGSSSLGRSFSLKRKKTWKRMTGYLGGSSDRRRRRRRRARRGSGEDFA